MATALQWKLAMPRLIDLLCRLHVPLTGQGGYREIRTIEGRAAEDVNWRDPMCDLTHVDQKLSLFCHAHVIIVGLIRYDDCAAKCAKWCRGAGWFS